MRIETISLGRANHFVEAQDPSQSRVRLCHFCIGAFVDGRLCGVAIVGRPKHRCMDAGGDTLELTRVYTDGNRDAYLALVAEAKRRARATGATRLIPSSMVGCACSLCAERIAA